MKDLKVEVKFGWPFYETMVLKTHGQNYDEAVDNAKLYDVNLETEKLRFKCMLIDYAKDDMQIRDMLWWPWLDAMEHDIEIALTPEEEETYYGHPKV